MKTIFVVFYLFTAIVLYSPLRGQQAVQVIKSKVINGEVRWSGQILIRGDVVIGPSGMLQIAPGTRIMFDPNSDVHHSGFDKTRCELIVKGTIFAKGSINQKIVFTSAAGNPRMQDWGGIVILNGNKPAVFEFAVVEYAYNGFDIKKSNPIIRNCQIQFNYNAGLKIAVRSRAKLIGNIIRDNGYAGVVCETGAQPVLTDNLITKNQIGCIVFGSAQPNLGDLRKGPSFNPGRNAMFDNLEYDLYNHSANDLKAEGNSWGSKNLNDILARIYDKKDADRFGAVDFNPIMGNVDLFKKMLLAQQTPAPAAAVDSTQTGTALAATAPPKKTVKAPGQTKQVSLPQPKVKKETKLTDTASAPVAKPKPALSIARAEEGKAQDTSTVEKSPARQTVAAESVATVKPKEEEPPKIDFNQVFLDVFLDHKVKVIKEAKPVIDDPAKGMYEHGRIVVRVVVNRQGNVEQAQVLKGLNYYYDQLSLDAAKKFRFKPGTVKGVPVRFSTSILFMF